MEYGERPMRSFSAPVKVGDEVDVKIEAVGEKGDGLAKKDGFVLFVPNTKEGDEVKVKVTRVLRKVGFADVVGEGSPEATDSQDSSQEGAEEGDVGEEPLESGEDSEDFGEEAPAEEEPQA